MSQDVRYLSPLELVTLNRQLCQTYQVPAVLVSYADLQAALQRPQVRIDGYEPFPELFEKAAVLMDALVKAQAFLHLNALTGFLAADILLRLNGQCLSAEPGDAEQILSVKLQQLTIPQIAAWLKLKAEPKAHG